MSDETVALTANPSTAKIVRHVLRVGSGARVELDETTKAMLRERRDQVENFVEQFDEPAYGFDRWTARRRRGSGRICSCPMRPDLAGAEAGKLLRNAV
jgi:hypothetical protein